MTLEVKVEGVDRLIDKLTKVASVTESRGTMQAALDILKSDIAPYPPKSDANVPFQRRWYERGYGPKWMLRDGRVAGKRTSQTLGRKWTTKVGAGGKSGVVGTNVTYAPYVQSAERQTTRMKHIGWRTDADTIKAKKDEIVRLYKDAIRRLWDR